jgi:uncharacterized protein (DUF58 family)
MAPTLSSIDPAQLAKIVDLQLLARTVVEGMLSGLHRSPHSGSSIEFAQYRPYAQGDDPRFIDWNLYGRTDRLHIKQFQEETNLRCTLILDCSASMGYGSGGLTKFQYARMLTACMAMILHKQRDAVGFIAHHEELLDYVPPRTVPHHLNRILVDLDNLEPAGQTDAAGALHYLGDVLQPRGMVVLISDLLHPVEETIDHLKSLRARRHDVVVMQISDPAEQTFPFDKTTTFVDMESGNEQYAVPDLVREQYLANRESHFALLRKECLATEIDLAEFTTDESLDHALYFFLRHRSHALMTTSLKRRRGPVAGSL